MLLASADSKLRELLRNRLGSSRWSIFEAGSGAEAFEKMSEQEAAVLLVDNLLPDLDSSEFCDMVMAHFPRTEILTINARTGHASGRGPSPSALSVELLNSSGGLCRLPRAIHRSRSAKG